MSRYRKLLSLGATILCACLVASAQVKEFTKWPAGSSPTEIGNRVAERFLSGGHPNFGRSTPPASITYPEVCTWWGTLTFAQLSHNQDLTNRAIKRFDKLMDEESNMIPKPVHVDATVFGSVPLEIYIQT